MRRRARISPFLNTRIFAYRPCRPSHFLFGVSILQAVAECAVVGMKDDLKGERPLGLIVLKQGHVRADVVPLEVKELVRKSIGAFACFEEPIVVSRLPKTRSGKVLRRIIRKIANAYVHTLVPGAFYGSVLTLFFSLIEKRMKCQRQLRTQTCCQSLSPPSRSR
jgi:acyl-CoA synthetase (AMP-forming)/AMP-acid ligase II